MKTTSVVIVAAALAAFSCTAPVAKAQDTTRKIVPVRVGAMTCNLHVYRPRLWKRSNQPQHDRFDAPMGIECPNKFQLIAGESNAWLTKNGVDYRQDPTIFYTFSHQESDHRAYTTTSLSCANKPAQAVNWYLIAHITIKYNGVKYRLDDQSDPAALFCNVP